MKNKILGLGLVLALVAVMVMPLAVSAATTNVTGTVDTQTTIAPTVTSCEPPHGSHLGGAIAVIIHGANFNQGGVLPSAITVSGSGVTVGTFNVVDPDTITTTFTIAANAAPGARNVTVTLDAHDGTGNGIFTVDQYITVTAPSAVDLGTMTVGSEKAASSTTAGSVETNATTYSVTAIDSTTASGHEGHMYGGGIKYLFNQLQISQNGGSTKANAATGISYLSTPTLPFWVGQTVVLADVAGSYTITITFTGSTP